MNKLVKLYDVPPNTKIGVKHLGLKSIATGAVIEQLDFCYLDGSFSYCLWEDHPIHLKADTEVYIL